MGNTSVDQAFFSIISNKRRANKKLVRSCIITLLHREQRCNFLCNRRRDPTKDKSAQIAQQSTTLRNFWGPGPIPWDFSGPSGANKTPQRGLTPRKHITSNRCAPDTRQASEMFRFETFTSLLANRARPRESVMTRCAQLDSVECEQCGQGQSSHLDIDIRPPLH